ncbi:Transcription initiation factor TFIID subunit like [Actinidia chinensis var. chinensis]|uniref:Transcription initiation factor TFIID subunit 8 n=1 Tax=Actinidia chinensis var. chinensis TaxID=1590841 RepID=A0A2R6RKG2_ACTCC|nr:Transcription initiation factor TFIID subunit like [Actinidia chinensis var. chinensis]
MNDGGGESGREHDDRKRKKKSRTDDFAQSIAKIAVAQVCESAGFQIFQQSALNTLSDVAVRYIREIGNTANIYANLGGRTESNVFDIIQGLEDLGSSQGFSGASDINHCLVGSGTVGEIIQYVGHVEEIPFAYSIPGFPVIKDRKLAPSFAQVGETSPDDHIPSWLPAFPDPQTYLYSPSCDEREVETGVDKIAPGEEQGKVERSLLNLQQQLACNGSEGPAAFDSGDAAKAKEAAASNPFLAAPLRFGEKAEPSVVLQPRLSDEAAAKSNGLLQNHVSVFETFAPAIEAMKSTLCDSEEGGKKVLLNTRSTVQFKVGIGKKSLGTSMSLQNEGIDKINSWFGDNNEKDDKKRRAEQILKESMESTQELAQL